MLPALTAALPCSQLNAFSATANAFPTEAIYGDAPGSQLRLITCGEDFDDTSRRYSDNIIVYALRAGRVHGSGLYE